MSAATVVHGYILQSPNRAENTGHVVINQFEGGSLPWQAQIFDAEGSLEAAEYFSSEVDALRWAICQGLVPAIEEAQPTTTFAALSDMHSAYGRLHDLVSEIAEEDIEWSEDVRKRLANLLAGPCLAAMATAGAALANEIKPDAGAPRSYREFLESVAAISTLADALGSATAEGAALRTRYQDVGDYLADLDDERLCSEFSAFEKIIEQARALKAIADVAASEHPAIKFCQAKEIVAKGSNCDRHCGPRTGSACGCIKQTAEIFRLFGIEVPDLENLEDGEVLGLCHSGMLVQWNGDERQCYVSDTLEEFGVNNLRDEELARLRLPPAASDSAPAA